MERTRTTVLLLLAVGLTSMIAIGAVDPGAAANPAAGATASPRRPTASTPALAAAGETPCSSCLKCPCGCSPLAGAWVAKLDCDCGSSKESIIQTFKFAPVNDGCTKFVVNSQAVTRLAKVAKFFPDACDQTEFVGIACKDEWKNIKLTAVSYGVKRCVTTPKAGVIIGVHSGGHDDLPDDDGQGRVHCRHDGTDRNSGGLPYVQRRPEGRQRQLHRGMQGAQATPMRRSTYRSSMPHRMRTTMVSRTRTCDEPVLCVRCETCLKRVELMEPCDAQTKNFTACLGPCKENNKDVNTPATGRAFVTVDETEQDVDAVVTVKDIKDVTKAALQINGADVLILFPVPPDKPKDGDVEGLLVCAEFPVKDFIGSLKGKKLEDLLKAIEEGRVTVVVSTKKFPNGEICGTVEDP